MKNHLLPYCCLIMAAVALAGVLLNESSKVSSVTRSTIIASADGPTAILNNNTPPHTVSRNESLSFWSNETDDSGVQRHNTTKTVARKIIYFLHIHKSGGSSICRSAVDNGEIVSGGSDTYANCNVQKDQKCCGGSDTLEAQQRFARQTNLTFVAAERGGLYQNLDPDNYHYMTVLRHSAARYYSHFRFCCQGKYIIRLKRRYNWTEWYEGQPDNYNMRVICGPDCFDTRKYQLSRAQFDATLLRLHLFDSILFLENFSDSYTKFRHAVNWNNPLARLGLTGFNQTPEEMDDAMTLLDDALYEYAVQLDQGVAAPQFSNATRDKLERYFRHGHDKNCRNACCGHCSPY